MNNKINCIHERALRLVYSGHVSSFDDLLKKDQSFSIHHTNIKSLAIELYKFFHSLSPISWPMSSILKQIFHTILGHTVNFIVEIQKQWNMQQKLYLTWHLKYGL